MTYEEKLKLDKGVETTVNQGCPFDHGYEERVMYSAHCAHTTCERCWGRQIKEKNNEKK